MPFEKQTDARIDRSEDHRPLTVLLVEDEPDVAEAIMDGLVDAGHGVVGPYPSAKAAEVAAGLHQLDAAIIDIGYSGEADGLALARSLGARWGLPMIVVTSEPDMSRDGDEAPILRLTKPFSIKSLLAALDTLDPYQTVPQARPRL